MQQEHDTVAASATEVELLAARLGRLGATIVNDSASATLYLKLGTGATTSVYTVPLAPGAVYELPLLPGDRVWDGAISGIWTAAVGNARTSEVW